MRKFSRKKSRTFRRKANKTRRRWAKAGTLLSQGQVAMLRKATGEHGLYYPDAIIENIKTRLVEAEERRRLAEVFKQSIYDEAALAKLSRTNWRHAIRDNNWNENDLGPIPVTRQHAVNNTDKIYGTKRWIKHNNNKRPQIISNPPILSPRM